MFLTHGVCDIHTFHGGSDGYKTIVQILPLLFNIIDHGFNNPDVDSLIKKFKLGGKNFKLGGYEKIHDYQLYYYDESGCKFHVDVRR